MTLVFLFTFAIGNVWADITWTAPQSSVKVDYQQTMSDGSSKFHNKNSATSTSQITPEEKTNKWSIKTNNSGGFWIIPNEAITKVTINYLCGSTNSGDITYKVQTSNYGNNTSSASTATFAVKTTADKNKWFDAELTINVEKDQFLYVKFPTNVYISHITLTTSGGGCTANPATPTKFDAESITENGVTFSITDAANAGKYDIYYSTSNTAPEATTAASATSTAKTKAITGLTASTKYYAWVRSVCDNSHKSDWVALTGGFFTTLSGPRDLYKINMTAASETNMPHGQKVELTSTYGTVTGGYADLYNKHSSDDSKLKVNSNGITFSGGDPCVILYLNEPLHVGDKIEFTSSSSNQIKIGVVDNKDQTLVTTSNKSYTVASEGLAGKQVIYLWRVSNTTYIKTLTISTTAEQPTFRTVTFDPNYTSATNITRTVADGAKVVYVPKDPENGTQEFEGWFEGSASSAFDFSTVITADKTLTAHWSAPVVKHTISFNSDGGTAVEPIEVEDGQVAIVPTAPKKVGYEFDKWYNGEAVYDWSAAVTDDLTLTAHWNKIYVPQGANYVFENTATLGTAPNAITVTKDNKTNAIAANSRIDNMWLSAMSVKLEDGTYSGSGDDFKGWKINTSTATIRFFVENDSRVIVTVGNLSSGMNIAYTGTDDAAHDEALSAKNANVYNVKGGTLVTLTTQGGNTVTLKGIAVSEIPAQSDDATLSDLKVGGTTISGFSASKLDYSVELPYGSTSQPEVTATPNDANVTSVGIAQNIASLDDATITVTAENHTTTKTYTVHFTVAPKLGVELIKATHTGETTASKEGYWTADATVDKNTHADSKLGGKDNYFGLTLGGTKKFMNGDLVVIYLDPAQAPSAWLQLFKDKGSNIIADVKTGVKKGANYITLAGLPEEGIDALYLYRTEAAAGNMNPYVDYIAVYRLMAPFIESFEIEGIDNLEIDQTNKTITAFVSNSFDVTALTPTVKYWGNGGGAIDKTDAQNFTDPVTYTVSSAYADDATGDYAPVTYTVTITKVVPSVEPTITTQPQGANYIEGASIAALTVAAESTAGTLSYQWQIKNGLEFEDIDGATAASYTPTVSAIGSYIYRVVVTNTEDSKPATSVNSDEATIVIAEDPSCKAIGYGTTRDLAKNTEVVIDATAGLKHKSSEESYETGKKIAGETNLTTIKFGGAAAYYDIYTTEMNIGSIALSLTSSSNGEDKRYKYAVIFCSSATFDESKILGVVEQTCGAGDDEQVINTPEVPLGTKLIRIKRQYTYKETTYGQGNSSYIYYLRACLVEPAQEVTASVTDEPASANYCPSDVVAPLAYELSIETGASAAYQWYKGTEAIEGATTATYTPSETGVYTCKAALTKTGRMPKNLTSAEATVNFYVATAITAHADAIGDVDAEKTVSVTAEGTNLSYQWQACDERGVVTDVTVLGTVASMNVTIAAEAKYYLATITGACGIETQVVVVREWHEVAQADVNGYQKWDWNVTSNAAAWAGVANIQLTDADKTTDFIMANTASTMPNNDAFRSDMLITNGEYPARPTQDGGVFQGYAVKFHTTVPGKVTVVYRGTGGSAKVNLKINDWTPGETSDWKTKNVVVPAGDVVITDVNNAVLRIRSIEFDPNLDPNEAEASSLGGYTRSVTEGRYGTICLPNGGIMVGAELYEVAYYDGTYEKIFLDEVLNGEMVAGRPYIFLTKEGVNQIAVFYTDAAGASAGDYRGLFGSYTKINLAANGHIYILKDNRYYFVDTDNVYCGENRAYFKMGVAGGISGSYVAPAPGRRRTSIGAGAPAVATGVEDVQGDNVQCTKVLINGELFIIRGEKMYDAKGQLVK